MSVILTTNPSDSGKLSINQHSECACDCDCACPVDGKVTPVLSLPVAYYLELTPMCNNRCPGCGNVYAWQRAALPAPLDGDGWCRLIRHLAAHAYHLKITGGEPTLHPDFAEILETVDSLNIPFTLFTAGRWHDPEAIVRRLRNTPTCEGCLISLHGSDAATHEAFCNVSGAFDETVANIRRAAEAEIDVAVSFVINRHNWQRDHIEATLDLALSSGVTQVVCNRLIGNDIPGITPSPAQLRAAVATIESLREAGHPIRFGNCIPQCFAASSSTGCTAGSTFATLDPWGRMRPCNHAPVIAGDLNTQTVEAVWRGAVMTEWRARVPEGCAACAAFALCHGGCRAQALLTGQEQDPLIQMPPLKADVPAEALRLYAGLRPLRKFTQRAHDLDVLIYKSRVVGLPKMYAPLARDLNGDLTLQQIQDEYGLEALDWIEALYRQGMLTWA